MKCKALKKLADYLMTFKPEPDGKQFDMSRWYCNTSACAIGHGILAKVTPPGLRLKTSIPLFDHTKIEPAYKEYRAMEAVAKAYNIKRKSAYSLFQDRYPSNRKPRTVAKDIYKFLADGHQERFS